MKRPSESGSHHFRSELLAVLTAIGVLACQTPPSSDPGPSDVSFLDPEQSRQRFFDQLKIDHHLSEADTFEKIDEFPNHLGFIQTRYQQMHRGIRVNNGVITIQRRKDGNFTYAGPVVSGVHLDVHPLIDETFALDEAVKRLFKTPIWKVDPHQPKPKGELIILYNEGIQQQEPFILTYRFHIQTKEREFYVTEVDAKNGRVLGVRLTRISSD